MRVSHVVSLAAVFLATLLSACRSNRDRVVVPEHIYKYASKSNADIVDELSFEEAYDVLKSLERVNTSRHESSKGPDESTIPAEVPIPGNPGLRIPDDQKRDMLLVELDDNKAVVDSWRLPTQARKPALKSGHYFSTLTAIAIEEGLEPTAIPALVVGYRPQMPDSWPTFLRESGLGIDLVVGGALNSAGGNGDSENDVALALGLGLTFPWSDSGALSFGAITWREDAGDTMGAGGSNTEIAFYIGISLGSFNVNPQQQ